MPTKTSVVMQTTDQAQKKSSRSITYIDPNASNSDIKNFVEGMNDLTTQTLTAANRVDTTDILDATEKLPRNLQLSSSTIDVTTISQNVSDPTETTLTGAGLSTTDLTLTKTNNATYMYVDWSSDGEGGIIISLVGDMVAQTASASELTFKMPETDTYEAASITLKLEKQ